MRSRDQKSSGEGAPGPHAPVPAATSTCPKGTQFLHVARAGCGARGNTAGALLTVTERQPAHGSVCFFLRPNQTARRGMPTAPPTAVPRPPTRRGLRPLPQPGSQALGGWGPCLRTPKAPHLPPFRRPFRPPRLRLRGGGRTACSPTHAALNLAIPHASRRSAHSNGPADLESSKPLRTRSKALNVRAPPSPDHAPFRQGASRRHVLPIIHFFPRETSQQVSDWLIMGHIAEECR